MISDFVKNFNTLHQSVLTNEPARQGPAESCVGKQHRDFKLGKPTKKVVVSMASAINFLATFERGQESVLAIMQMRNTYCG